MLAGRAQKSSHRQTPSMRMEGALGAVPPTYWVTGRLAKIAGGHTTAVSERLAPIISLPPQTPPLTPLHTHQGTASRPKPSPPLASKHCSRSQAALGSRSSGWAGTHSSPLPTSTGAYRDPALLCPLHPGFRGSAKHLPDPTVWVVLTELQSAGAKGGAGELFRAGKRAVVGVGGEAMTGLAGLGPSAWPLPPTTPGPAPLAPQSEDAKAEGKWGVEEGPSHALGWGEQTSAQTLGGPQC